MFYNQFNMPSYTEEEIIDKCKKCKNRKEFYSIGIRKTIYRMGLKERCLSAIDDAVKPQQEQKVLKIKSDIETVVYNYRNKQSFREDYPKLYYAIITRKWLYYFDHMIPQNFSMPQIIMRKILEEILHQTCSYNCRSILPNKKELDIYFPKFRIAGEYNGWFWHKDKKMGDESKKEFCEENNIYLLTINEPFNNAYSTLDKTVPEIQKNIITHIKRLNEITGLSVEEKDVYDVVIDSRIITEELYGKDTLDNIIDTYDKYSDIKNKHNRLYQFL